jgi:hypothetical protein
MNMVLPLLIGILCLIIVRTALAAEQIADDGQNHSQQPALPTPLSESRRDGRIPRSLRSFAVVRTGPALGEGFQVPTFQTTGETGFDNVANASHHPQAGLELQLPAMRDVGQGRYRTGLAQLPLLPHRVKVDTDPATTGELSLRLRDSLQEFAKILHTHTLLSKKY